MLLLFQKLFIVDYQKGEFKLKTMLKRFVAGGLLATLTVASISACGLNRTAGMQQEFNEFIKMDFVDSMEDNWLNAHIFLENPENYGVDISKAPVEYGAVLSDESYEENLDELKRLRMAFDVFDRAALTEAQKDTYDNFQYMLTTAEMSSEERFKNFDFSFSTLTGVQCQIPTLITGIELREPSDVEHLITLVGTTDEFIQECLDFVDDQIQAGTLFIDQDAVVQYADQIVDGGMEGSTLKSMVENIEKLDLDETQQEDYIRRLEEVYEQDFLPAYENISDKISKIDPEDINQGGLGSIDDGKEFYEILFRNAVGTSKSIEDVRSMLNTIFEEHLTHAQQIVMTGDGAAAYEAWMNDDMDTGYSKYEDVLTDLWDYIQEDFPEIEPVDYVINTLPDDLENEGIQAYYIIPALDNTRSQKIFVNSKANSMELSAVSTFTLLAHEGLPGHMYQTNYTQNKADLCQWDKTVGGQTGYSEGYATYIETYVTKYLADSVNELALAIENDMTVVQNCFIALIDIGIHYDGWSLREMESFAGQMGFDASSAEELYNQIQANPAAFASYYVGYAEIETLRNKAEEALGDKFSEKEFHEALLKSGDTIFDVVERNINQYIEETK